jgi:ABC-2 type transport system permease protein
MRRAWAFLVRDFLIEASYPVSFVTQFAGMILSVALFYFIAQVLGAAASPYLKDYGGDYFSFALIGIAFGGYFGVGLQAFSRALRESQTTGTLEAMLITPTRVSTIVLASALYAYLYTTVRVGAYLLIGALFFGLRLQGANILGGLAALVLSVISFSAIGVLSASFTMLFKRGDPLTFLLANGVNLLGGVYFPVEIFAAQAPWLLPISQLLPLTYALHAMRLALLQGAGWDALWGDLLALTAFAVVLLPASLLSFNWAVDRARVDGSLTHF